MSYKNFARQYRPQTFEELVGQHTVKEAFTKEILAGKVNQAYMFTGPRGIGKTSTARILAKTLNCTKNGPPNPEPCNECENCIEITESRSIDVMEIDGASNNGVAQVREVIDAIRYLPAKSRYKIYIIDEFHMLTQQAFNALLKTLEEPPPHSVFITATTEPHKVIPTIKSRMKIFNFLPISIDDIKIQIASILDKINVKYEQDALFYIAKCADGAMRDALSILDVVTSIDSDTIHADTVLSVLGLPKEDNYFKFLNCIIEKNAAGIVTLIDEIITRGENLNVFAQQLLEFTRHLLILKKLNDAPAHLVPLSKEIRDTLLTYKDKFTETQILEIINLLIDLSKELKQTINARITFENYMFQILRFDEFVTLGEVVAKLEDFEKKYKDAGSIEKISDVGEQPEKQKPVKKEYLKITENFFTDFINVVSSKDSRMGAILKGAVNVISGKLDEGILTLCFGDNFHVNEMNKYKANTEKEFEDTFNKKITIEIERVEKKQIDRSKQIEKVKDIFEGDIVNEI